MVRTAGAWARLGRNVGASRLLASLALTYAVGVATGLGLPTMANAGSEVSTTADRPGPVVDRLPPNGVAARPVESVRLSVGDIIAANDAAARGRWSVGDIIAANDAAAIHAMTRPTASPRLSVGDIIAANAAAWGLRLSHPSVTFVP